MRRLLMPLLLLMAAPASAQQETIYVDRLMAAVRSCIGCTTFGATSPFQVVGLPTLAGTVVTVDGSGNIGSGNATVSGTLSSTAGLTTTSVLKVTGTTGLPTGGGTDFYLSGGSGTATARALVGDGSGWEFLFSSRTGSAWTDRISITDLGTIRPATNYTGNVGQYDRKFLTFHAAELWVSSLVASQVMATIGGRVMVVPTTVLTADLAAAGTTITVKHNQIANGDRLVLESNGQVEWMAVTSAAGGSSGAYTYTVTRNLDGSGANDWKSGDAVANTGTTGDGYIDLYATSGVIPGTTLGPTIVGNARTGTTYTDIAPRWAIGNLKGLYGISTDTYGLAAGDPSATYYTMDASNGFQMYTGATKKFWLTTGGVMALYDSATTYLQLTGGAIKMVEGGTEVFKLQSGVATFGQPLTANNTGQIQIDSDSLEVRWRDNGGTTRVPFGVYSDTSSTFAVVENWEFRGSTLKSYADASMTVSSGGTFTTLTLRGGSGGAGDVILYGPQVKPNANNTQTLGTSSLAWSELYLAPATTTTDYNPLVLGASGQVVEKTDGVSATFNPTSCTSFTFHSGLLVAKSGC